MSKSNVDTFEFRRALALMHQRSLLAAIADALWNVCDSIGEGANACRHYEHLRSMGAPHDTAIRAIFAAPEIGGRPSNSSRGQVMRVDERGRETAKLRD